MKKRFLCILLSAAVLMPSVPVFAADLTNTISAEEKNDTESAEEEQSAYTLEETDGLDETEGMQNGEEQKKENSWRYSDGELIPDKERAVYSNDAWTKVDGYFINNVGEAIPNAVKKGIDVSHHQGAIDWNEVKNSDVEFVIIRCGYGDNVASQDDKQWLTNVEACERLGIPYGVYLYSYATTEAQARSEAEHALRLLKGHNPTYPVYYDMEDDSTLASSSQFAEFAEIFCSTIEAAGYEAGVYANLFWWNTYLTDERFAQWDRWVAQYNSQCDYQGVYSMWQCTSSGRVPGIEGFADINFQMSEIGQWYEKDGHKYYYLNGKMLQDQGYKIDGYWYYFGSEGEMYCAEWREKAGEMYYYDESGHLVSNQGLKIDGYWYYFTSSGKMLTGWRQKGNDRYYYDSNGHMLSDCAQYIDGYKYCFNSSGKMLISTWYNGEYYGPDGRQTTPPSGDSAYTIELPGGQTTMVVGHYDFAASQQAFDLLNQYRMQNGLYPLQQANGHLQAAANIRAAELAYLFDHTRPNGDDCFTVYAYSCAENIAAGGGYGGYQFGAEEAMNGWINSPGHNANMLNDFSSSVGISAFTQTVDGVTITYFVQLFAA